MNRIDPALFSACFEAWVAERWPEAPSLVALDGKTSRRSHDEAAGRRALHLVSAFATHRHLMLGQEAVGDICRGCRWALGGDGRRSRPAAPSSPGGGRTTCELLGIDAEANVNHSPPVEAPLCLDVRSEVAFVRCWY
jgi:hypothetical protein